MPGIRELLNIELPIIQAPMAGYQGSALVIAVSNAGGLGSLGCAVLSLDQVRAELSLIRAHTDKPYNVNFFCHPQPRPDPQGEEEWRRRLSPYYDEYGLPAGATSGASGRTPFNAEAAELLEEFKPPVVSFHFGLPSESLMLRVKALGATILSSATTVAEARWLEDRGVDMVIAQGLEAGGHRGMFLSEDLTTQVGTFALLPQIVGAVKVPVIAAGGIATAAGVAAAQAMGAAGVQVGTAYLLCPEVTLPPLHRAALQSEAARHTAVTNLFTGRPARGIVNRIIRELGPMNSAVPPFPLAVSAIAPLRAKAENAGDDGFSPLWCGQNASGYMDLPAAEVTRMLARHWR
jgi:nitronate monooxygenase